MSVANTPIIVSAPAGGLGRHLAALIDYAVNLQAESLDLSKSISKDIDTGLSEFVAPTAQPLSPLQFWDWNYDISGRIPVMYSTQTPTEIAKDYPTGRIIQVTTSLDDYLQLSYNYLVIEQWRSIRDILDIHYMREVAALCKEDDIVLSDVFSDSQFMDNMFVQVLIQRVGTSRITKPVSQDSRANLAIEFNSICCPANTASNINIKPILDFLGNIDRSSEEITAAWFTFVRSLHNAKRNILNTANWS